MVLVIVTYVEKILMQIFEFHETGCLQWAQILQRKRQNAMDLQNTDVFPFSDI